MRLNFKNLGPTFIIFVALNALAIDLRRDTTVTVHNECKTDEYAPHLREATAYINKIKDRIIQSNPDVFRGDLASHHICAGVKFESSQDHAQAFPEHRSFVVDSSMILRVQNDAQMAYVIAHELAHITLRHTMDGSPVTGAQLPAMQAALRRLHIATNALEALNKDASTEQRRRQLDEEITEATRISNAIISAQFGEAAVPNWLEVEGDLAGSHLALRAGFSADEVAWRQQQIIIATSSGLQAHSPALNISAAERRRRAYAACNVTNPQTMSEPARGNARYASECWMIWKLLHDEPARDSNYRNLMNDNTSIVNLPGEHSLQAAKDEITGQGPRDISKDEGTPTETEGRTITPAPSKDDEDEAGDN